MTSSINVLVHAQAGIALCVELKVSDLFLCNLVPCDYIMLLVWHAGSSWSVLFVGEETKTYPV